MNDLLKLKQRVEQAPQNELFRFSYAKALIDLHQEEEAIPHLEWCFQKKPDWMVVVMLLGRLSLQKGDLGKAKSYYQTGLNLAVSQKHEGPESEIREILSRI
ncbi:MAG: molecular chaperone DnaJ [Verrucomicrobiota bacterium]